MSLHLHLGREYIFNGGDYQFHVIRFRKEHIDCKHQMPTTKFSVQNFKVDLIDVIYLNMEIQFAPQQCRLYP